MTIYAFRPAPYDPLDSNNPQTLEFRGSNGLGRVVGFYNPNPAHSAPSYTTQAPAPMAAILTSTPLTPVTEAEAINNSDQIVGYDSDGTGGVDEGFLDSGGTFTTLDLPGATSTELLGINDSGQIVGSYDNAFGFLYTPGAAQPWTTIAEPLPPGYAITSLASSHWHKRFRRDCWRFH